MITLEVMINMQLLSVENYRKIKFKKNVLCSVEYPRSWNTLTCLMLEYFMCDALSKVMSLLRLRLNVLLQQHSG